MINAVAIICSVLGWLNPITGALVHNIGSCAVVLLAASLYNRDFSDYIKKSQAEPKVNVEESFQSGAVASVTSVFEE